MKNPLHEAILRRKSHSLDHLAVEHPAGAAVDDAKLSGQASGVHQESDDKKGDLAPDVENAELHHDGDHPGPEQEKAIHAKETLMPEHHPMSHMPEQNDIHQDASMNDEDVEHQLMQGHNEMLSRPKTLGARVRAALHSKKGK